MRTYAQQGNVQAEERVLHSCEGSKPSMRLLIPASAKLGRSAIFEGCLQGMEMGTPSLEHP